MAAAVVVESQADDLMALGGTEIPPEWQRASVNQNVDPCQQFPTLR